MIKKRKPFSILIVDSDKNLLTQLSNHLLNHYHKVYISDCNKDALLLYQSEKPDIIIIDINFNGLELIQTIRKIDLNVKIIILTASTNIDDLLKANSLKLIDYLVKPITRAILHKSLNKAITEFTNFIILSRDIIRLKENFIWYKQDNQLYCDNNIVNLRVKEQKLLTLLFSNINYVFTYDDISNELWDIDDKNKINSIKLIIKTIRLKLPKNTIKNVFKIGYKIVV